MAKQFVYCYEVKEPAEHRSWEPAVGSTTASLFERLNLPSSSANSLLSESLSLLGHCPLNVTPPVHETGLAFGYIQSGKTLSFTVLAALARDNGYKLVIVLCGTSRVLFSQSADRIDSDLQCSSMNASQWLLLRNPVRRSSTVNLASNCISSWRVTNAAGNRERCLLLVVMKHHKHISSLISFCSGLKLHKYSCIIIDDEGDQASLNTKVRVGSHSKTYQVITKLRDYFTISYFIQYTATPQAPLLLQIVDELSPRFVQVLTPGDEYIGGSHFFSSSFTGLSVIDDNELLNAEETGEIPDSLVYALSCFVMCCAFACASNSSTHLSMIIHPSRIKQDHKRFFAWAHNCLYYWKETLTLCDPDSAEMYDYFKRAYSDLLRTNNTFVEFHTLKQFIPIALHNIVTCILNSDERSEPIIWNQSQFWVIVGGQALDRGFTVEGLITSYMSRGVGVGNADTLQQRARFFGYKKRLLSLCRIWLTQETREAYVHYVEHEENIRSLLKSYEALPLVEWRRRFILAEQLQPTRSCVLSNDLQRFSFGGKWWYPRFIDSYAAHAASNQAVFSQRLSMFTSESLSVEDFRDSFSIQYLTGASLRSVVQDLLYYIAVGDKHLDDFDALLLILRSLVLEFGDDITDCFVFDASSGISRSLGEHWEIKELFQGRSKKVDGQPLDYPGDRNIICDDRLTIQVRVINFIMDKEIVFPGVFHFAVWVPERYRRSLLDMKQEVL